MKSCIVFIKTRFLKNFSLQKIQKNTGIYNVDPLAIGLGAVVLLANLCYVFSRLYLTNHLTFSDKFLKGNSIIVTRLFTKDPNFLNLCNFLDYGLVSILLDPQYYVSSKEIGLTIDLQMIRLPFKDHLKFLAELAADDKALNSCESCRNDDDDGEEYYKNREHLGGKGK